MITSNITLNCSKMVLLVEPSSEVLSSEDRLSDLFWPILFPCFAPPNSQQPPQDQTPARSHSHSSLSPPPWFSYFSYCSLSSSVSSVSSWLFSPPPSSRSPPVSDGKLHSGHLWFFCSWGSREGALQQETGARLYGPREDLTACLFASFLLICL